MSSFPESQQKLEEVFDIFSKEGDGLKGIPSPSRSICARATISKETGVAVQEDITSSDASGSRNGAAARVPSEKKEMRATNAEQLPRRGSSMFGDVELFAEAQWKPNAPACFLCNRTFSLFFRRHHCRSCGNCVCTNCSPFRVHLDAFLQRPSASNGGSFTLPKSTTFDSSNPMFGQAAHRICKECHGVGVGLFFS